MSKKTPKKTRKTRPEEVQDIQMDRQTEVQTDYSVQIPKDIRDLMERIQSRGHSVYLVGGCLRDHMLKVEPADYDLATTASPQNLVDCLTPHYKVFQVGQHFSTLIVRLPGGHVEVSSLRRRVDGVIYYDGTIESDLACRDFTINAMAMTLDGQLIDPLEGRKDIEKRRLRSVSPQALLREDPVRALRAIRFACKYDLSIDGALEDALYYVSVRRPFVSPERKREELFKSLLLAKPSQTVRMMLKYDLWAWFDFGHLIERMVDYDQKNPYHDKSLLEHTLAVLDETPSIIELRLAALFHDVGKPDVQTFDSVAHYYQHEKVSGKYTRQALHGLRASNKIIDETARLVEGHMFSPTDIGQRGLKRLLIRLGGYPQLYNLLKLMRADILGTAYPERATCMDDLFRLVKDMEDRDTAFRVKDLNVSGRDLMDIGVPQGKEIGYWLNRLLEAVMDDQVENDKDHLLDYIQANRPIEANGKRHD